MQENELLMAWNHEIDVHAWFNGDCCGLRHHRDSVKVVNMAIELSFTLPFHRRFFTTRSEGVVLDRSPDKELGCCQGDEGMGTW